MEGNGGGGGGNATPWDLGMHWAPAATSAFPPPPAGCPSQQELTCLELGKRPCCWGGAVAHGGEGHVHGNGGGATAAEGRRKEKANAKAVAVATVAAAAVPRCQVDGCHIALAGERDYHRRHKVCEAHSKAPRVVVHGAEQRFCQQCSRFHAISEFDEAKRSCRRRLAGHNERRRKSNASEAMARSSAHPHGVSSLVHGFPPYGALPTSPAGALSLLSSGRAVAPAPWLTTDISTRSSAALDELIAENRAALLSWHFFADRYAAGAAAWHIAPPPGHAGAGRHARNAPAGHVTLDLMQASNTTASAAAAAAFRAAPDPRTKPSADEGCSSDSDVWTSWEGARVV